MEFDLYKDIQKRTNGEIYIGIVGPVAPESQRSLSGLWICLYFRTSKMRKKKKRTLDELPQSAAGKTIMTTEPKFIPQEAAEITLADESSVSVRLIDCVGFMVEGANGHLEGDGYRSGTYAVVRGGNSFFGCSENWNRKSNQRPCNHWYCGDNGWQYRGTSAGKLCGGRTNRGGKA